jgi:flagellar biosynthesis protein FliR
VSAELLELAFRFGMVLTRVAACVVALPVIGGLPATQVRTVLIALLALVLTAADPPGVAHPPEALLSLAMAGLGEVIVGLGIGFTARLLLLAGEFAGQLLSISMGLSFMQVVDPMSEGTTEVMSKLYMALTVLVFFILGGHHAAIYGLSASFRAWPLGQGLPPGDVGLLMPHLAGMMFVSGLSLAAPVLLAVLAINVGLGIVARAAPRIQVFFLGFALAALVGLLVLITTLPSTVSQLCDLTGSLDRWLPLVLEQLRGAA